MAKIIGVCGSPRKGTTEHVLKRALAAAEQVPGIETELMLLRGKKIHRCIHCDKCLKSETPLPSYCVFDDDMKDLIDQYVAADGIIIATPVYGMMVTGLLKDFMDRMRCYLYIRAQRQQNVFKNMPCVGGAIAVGGARHGGQEPTLTAVINFFLTYEVLATGGPFGNYLGAAVWSKSSAPLKADQLDEVDPVGMDLVEGLGKRVAELALVLEAGRNALAEKGVTLSWMEST